MDASTVKDAATTTGEARASGIARRIDDLDPVRTPGEARLDAIGLGLVDALLAADDNALRAALDKLREARGRAVAATGTDERLMGWLGAAIAFCYWGLERLGPSSAPSGAAEGTHAWSFLQALRDSDQRGSSDLRDVLGVDDTEVSRSGRRLLEAGLVTRSKVGRQVFWRLTPRGRHMLGRPSNAGRRAGKRSRSAAPPGGVGADFWMEAIRQGFEGAAGDEPATGLRTVDPTRERIVESALELHKKQGVQETTFEQVAEKAGVPVETMESYFATRDDLVKGCGRHILTRLQIPPPDRAQEIFSDAASEDERVRRLVGTLFDVYERESESLERGRKDRAKVALVDEALGQVDASVDALVAEALRPLDPDAETVASVRALTDLEVWRALREAGESPSASVEDATATLNRWLGSQPRDRAPATT